MELFQQAIHTILHIDTYLLSFVSHYGVWTYIALFFIIFCETGFVITPFLPGDSLLFTAGSIAANHYSTLSIELLFVTLLIASILGNKLNYLIGKALGPKIFMGNRLLFNQHHLEQTHQFYEKHGGKTIILARFIPIIRTFAPFVAGMGKMNMQEFFLYNTISAVVWIGSLLGAGYFLGSLPIVKENFSIVIYSIIMLTLLPPLFAFCYRKASQRL
ncbi:MAG: DedA family protein [Gammaproteobacteria bacterium]|nr:DedA family protein [Gammaproteobacteria bacterium]